MALFPLPTPAEVLDDSRLRIEQINATYTASDTANDITQKINETAGVVEMRLLDAARPLVWPFADDAIASVYQGYTPEMRADYSTRQIESASLACKWLTLSRLYRDAGQLNARYEEKADQYEARAETLLESMVKTLHWVANESGTSTQGADFVLTSIPIFDGSNHCDELSGCH